MLVGVSGKAGVGKDLVAAMIQHQTNPFDKDLKTQFDPNDTSYGYGNTWQVKKFASKLKQIVSILTGISVEDLEKESVKNSNLPPEWDKFEWVGDSKYESAGNVPMTVRKLLQIVGTEAMRNNVHENVWVNALFSQYSTKVSSTVITRHSSISTSIEGEYPNWIITDVRFVNEAKAILDRGGVLLRINRPGNVNNAGNHPSETSLDDYKHFNHVIENDGTIEELYVKVTEFLTKFKLI